MTYLPEKLLAQHFDKKLNKSKVKISEKLKNFLSCGTITHNLNGQNLMNGNQGSFNDVKITSPNKSKQDRKYVIFKHLLRTHSKNQVARCFLVMFENISSHSKRW